MQQQNNRKNFVLIFGAAFLTYVNFYTSFTTFPLYIFQLGGTEFQAGLQNTTFYLAAVLLRMYFGPLGDRKGRKILLVIGTFVFATAPVFFILSNSLTALTLARLYQAIGFATFLSGGSSLVGDMAPAARMGTYVGIYRFIINLSLLLGPLAAMWVIEISDFQSWYLTCVIIGALAFILTAMIKPPALPAAKGKQEEPGSWACILSVVKNKDLWSVYGGFLLLSIAYGSLLAFVSLLIIEVTSIGNPGIYFTYFALASCVAYLVAGPLSDRFGREVIIWPSIILLGLGTGILLYLYLLPIVLVVSSILAGLGFAGGFATLNAWLIETAAKKVRSTALALMESTVDLSMAAASLVFGLTSGWIGLGASFAFTGVGVIIVALLFLFSCLDRSRSTASPEGSKEHIKSEI